MITLIGALHTRQSTDTSDTSYEQGYLEIQVKDYGAGKQRKLSVPAPVMVNPGAVSARPQLVSAQGQFGVSGVR